MSNESTAHTNDPNGDSTPISSWEREFDRRVTAFSEATKVDFNTCVEALKNLGVEREDPECLTLLDSDEFLPASDIFKAFVDTGTAKIAKVRLGIAHLRGRTTLGEAKPTLNGGGDIAQAITKLAEQNRRVEDLSIRELLERYSEGTPEIAERLNRITHGRPCIILNADGSVNIEESSKLVKTAQKQPTSDRHIVNGRIVRVYRAGTEFPVKPLEESPFAKGVPLVNGVCSRSGTDWNGVVQECRVLARIAADLNAATKIEMKQIWEDAKKGFGQLRAKYSEAAMRYDELEELGQLPTLKLRHDATVSTTKDRAF